MKCCCSCKDKGLLVIRVGIGLLIAIHGASVLLGGVEMWNGIGGMAFGSFMPTVAGFIAGAIMLLGGLGFALGVFFRFASAALAIVMIVAAIGHFKLGQGLYEAIGPWSAINLAILFIGMIGVGPGKFALCCKCCQSACTRDKGCCDKNKECCDKNKECCSKMDADCCKGEKECCEKDKECCDSDK